jgi:4-amino-4-deoxy-L-arabinose transferase-like glycosyltransferase
MGATSLSTSSHSFARPAIPREDLAKPHKAGSFSWWEKEIALLTLLVLGIFATRLTYLPIRGEESRRAQIAREMMQTGDWVVPRQQGEPFFSRPPFANWLIAAAAYIRGECDATAARLPSILATLLTTLLIYRFGRTFMSRLGAMTAGAAYATMAQVMELGRLAETEAVFTLLVSASLLVWHWGYSQGWPAARTWTIAYLLAALGTLTKGPQAPIYFTGAVVCFLLLTRNWRYLITRAHALGLVVFAVVVAAWQVPFYFKLGWSGVRQIWTADTAMRFADIDRATAVHHLTTYPLEILSCTMPWSLLVFCFLSRAFRQSIGTARSHVLFLATCLAFTLPSCWFVPGAQSRYFMPLYPCLATLIGLAVERCMSSSAGSPVRKIWSFYLFGLAINLAGLALLVLGVSVFHFPSIPRLAQPPLTALVYSLAAVGMAWMTWKYRHSADHRLGQVGMLVSAGFVGLVYTVGVLNSLGQKSEDAALSVALVKERLPDREHMVSFGPINHLFAFLYGDAIELRAWPKNTLDLEDGVTYFCFDRLGMQPINLPFPWEEVGVISCDRYRSAMPQYKVVVGRRLKGEIATAGRMDTIGKPASQPHCR